MEQLDILLPRHPLEEALGSELAKQARLRWGEQCRFMPVSDGQRYLCSCGCVNPLGEPCAQCGQMPELMDKAVLEGLRQEAAARLEEEAKEAARQEEARRQEEKRKKRRKIRTICLWAAGAAGALALAVAAFWGITRFAIPADHYHKALSALEKENYRLSHREFTLAGDYKDAKAYLARFATPLKSSKVYLGNTVTEMLYTYDETGRLLKSVQRILAKDADGNWLETEKPVEYVQRYDEQGNQLVQHNRYGHVVYVYNAQGDIVSAEIFGWDGQHETTKTYTFTYDAQGRKEKETEICAEHISVNYSYEQTRQYTYDDQGRVIREETQENYPAQMENSNHSVITWRYNEKGDPVEKVEQTEGVNTDDDDSIYTTTWRYDAQGRMVENVAVWEYLNDSSLNRIITENHTYDAKGRKIRSVHEVVFPQVPYNNSTDTHTWEYNKEGKLICEKSQLFYPDAGRQKQGGHTHTITYTYDLLGRMRESENVWEGPVETTRQLERYTYDAQGLVEMKEVEHVNGESRTGSISYYNANGLVQREEHFPEAPSAKDVIEYTYAYFYYPDGAPEPQQNLREPGAVLYGY